MKAPVLSIIVPCYNEESVIRETMSRLLSILEKLISDSRIDPSSFIYFIDDGSNDNTWHYIENKNRENKRITGLKLSRNFGHQNALLAGLLGVKDKVDIAISLDSDLQQDENAIPLFIEKYANGADIVLGIRKERDTDSFFKKFSALIFYKLMKLMGSNVIKNHADYRLINKKALNAVSQYTEINLFLRGIFTDIGFKIDFVEFDVKERVAGKSKYSLRKMLSFALNGVTSFTTFPLRLVTLIGFFIFMISAVMMFYVLVQKIFYTDTVHGWASTVLPIYFLGGIQIICIGLIGEYLAKIYIEVKGRPRFIKDIDLLENNKNKRRNK